MNLQKSNSEAIYWLYDFLLLGFCLGRLPGFLFEYFTTAKYREDLWQRFGLYSPKVRRRFRAGQSAWIHAVSVGEVAAATPLIRELLTHYPDLPLTISTVTRTGREMVKKSLSLPNQFLPFDFRLITERVMSQIQPRFLLLTETEIWPNLIRSAAYRHIPVMIMNGRLSSRSYHRYYLVRGLLRPVLSKINIFAMQSARDAERIMRLGAAPQKVFVTGNLKFDQAGDRISIAEQKALLPNLRLSPQTPVLTAGSTHEGESEIIIEIYRHLLAQFPDLVLLIAPRYLPEISGIEAACRQEGLFSERKTQMAAPKSHQGQTGRVIILDTIGELSKMYSLATVVFVGGSLVPRGGHNLLEPAIYGKPVLFGPYVDNFKEISRLLKDCGAGFKAKNKEELQSRIETLLQNKQQRDQAGQSARRVVEENRGATQKTMRLIKTHLMKLR